MTTSARARLPRPAVPAAGQPLAIAGALLAMAIVITSIALSRPDSPDPWWVDAACHLAGLVPVVAGVWLWVARPVSRRLGVLVVALGVSWYAVDLRHSDLLVAHSVGSCLYWLHLVVLGHVVLAYPSGRLSGVAARTVVAVAYPLNVGLETVRYATERMTRPTGPLNGGQRPAWAAASSAVGLVLTVAMLVIAVNQWRRASGGPDRRYLTPAWIGAALGISVTAGLAAAALDVTEREERRLIALHGIALGILVAAGLGGVLRARVTRAGVIDVLIQLERNPGLAGLQQALAEALHDPHLRLALWDEERGGYQDTAGRPVRLDALRRHGDHGDQVVDVVDGDGRYLAAVVHDAALARQPELMQAMLAAVRLVLDNARQLAELRRSRTRIVQAELAGRRQVQRDLHDGAQQELVALNLSLHELRRRLPATPHGARQREIRRLADQAIADAAQATESLRSLARGVLPPVLTHLGLAQAVRELALRAPLPVHCDLPDTGCSTDAAAAAYFLISEALMNAGRHASASQACVTVYREQGELVVRVADDGTGGADPARGTGLRGLRDRLEGLGGRLEVTSSPTGGTTVTGYLPCG